MWRCWLKGQVLEEDEGNKLTQWIRVILNQLSWDMIMEKLRVNLKKKED